MRTLDHKGFLLCEYQAKLFEKSADLKCSSPVFLRRFLHSDHRRLLDENRPEALTLVPADGIDEILEQYDGDIAYGKNKFSRNTLFWMGYMYRYICYTREQDSPLIMHLFSYTLLNDVYYAYHTQDPEWVIASLLDCVGLDENIFDNNYRLRMALKKRYEEEKDESESDS